ncbi:hypothetical protein Tco_1070499 [Tanacetum coccineum]|uniref:Uncharacterized protein n=1 Tax=Tanacetum coccineum TaxID=301880 RepID=A0ABQ5HNE4_9ASTR
MMDHPAKKVTNIAPAQPTIRGLKTYSSMSPEKQKLTNAEAEAYGNSDIGTAVEYQKASLASIDVSTLDKPHFQLENLSRRFIHESNPDDAILPQSHQEQDARSLNQIKNYSIGEIGSLDEIRVIARFEVMSEHAGRQEMMQDLKISQHKFKRRRLKIKDPKA